MVKRRAHILEIRLLEWRSEHKVAGVHADMGNVTGALFKLREAREELNRLYEEEEANRLYEEEEAAKAQKTQPKPPSSP